MNQGLGYEIAQTMPLAYATGLFASSATFLQPVQTQGPTGNPIAGAPTPISGLIAIPAVNAPRSIIAVSSDETRELPHIESKRERHMLLKGYYPVLDTGFSQGAGMGWQVQITDPGGNVNVYDFLGGEGDSQSQMTRVRMILVTV